MSRRTKARGRVGGGACGFRAAEATPRKLVRNLSIRKPYQYLNAEEMKAFANERGASETRSLR